MKIVEKLVFALLLLTVVSNPMNTSAQAVPRKRVGTRFPASRVNFQGDIWLTWLNPIRVWFVESALIGYEVGYGDGCADAMAPMERMRPHGRQKENGLCPNRLRLHHKAVEYTIQVNDFYTKYPEDRDIPIAFLLADLIAAKPKTFEEIHRFYIHEPIHWFPSQK